MPSRRHAKSPVPWMVRTKAHPDMPPMEPSMRESMGNSSEGMRAHTTATESRGTLSEVVGAHLEMPTIEPSAREPMGISPKGVRVNPDTPPRESSARESMGILPEVMREYYMETEAQDAEW